MNWAQSINHARDPKSGIINGAEPFEFPPHNPKIIIPNHAILFLHGWTSSPRELKFLAQKLSGVGFHCQGILLPGHGTEVSNLAPTRFHDYLHAAETAYDALALHFKHVSLVGLSMGGLLSLYLASKRPVKNLLLFAPFLMPAGKTYGIPNTALLSFLSHLPLKDRYLQKSNPPIFSQAWKEHIAYPSMPLLSLLSIIRAANAAWNFIPKLSNPTLIFHSRKDTTSAYCGSEKLLQRLGTQNKNLQESPKGKHILTLDFDREEIEQETLRWLLIQNSENSV